MERLINNNEAADLLGISPFSLRGKVSRREVPFVKLGRRVFFSKKSLMELVEKCTVQARPRKDTP